MDFLGKSGILNLNLDRPFFSIYLSNQEYMEKYTDRKLQQSFSTKMGSEHLNRHIVNDIYGVFDRAKMKQYKKDMEKLTRLRRRRKRQAF